MKGNFTVTVNFDEVIDDLFESAEREEFGCYPSTTFKEALQHQIVSEVKRELMKGLKDAAYEQMREQGQQQIQEFINGELKGIITRKLRAGEFRTPRGGFQSFDQVIENHLTKMNVENAIARHMDIKADAFAKEMKARYDNVFAAKVVARLKEQKLLAPDVARLLLGDDDAE